MVGILDDHDYGQNDAHADNPWKHFAKVVLIGVSCALSPDPDPDPEP